MANARARGCDENLGSLAAEAEAAFERDLSGLMTAGVAIAKRNRHIPEKPVAHPKHPAYIPRSISQEWGVLRVFNVAEDVIRLEGLIIEVLKEATLFRVELVNGHRLLGHVSKRRRVEAGALKPGYKVNLELSPFDFSKGRIVLEEKQNESSRIS